MKKIILVGDSHVLMYAGLVSPKFDYIHCGACTAYSLMATNSKTKSFQTLIELFEKNKPNENRFIFLFGEIDCRFMIYYKHIKFCIPLMYVIDIVVYRYFSMIHYCRDLGFDVAIHGIIPAVHQSNEYSVDPYGDNFIRTTISNEFNNRCFNKAIKDNIPYFNCTYFPYIKDSTGMVPINSLSSDLVHIDPNKVPIADNFSIWLQLWKEDKIEFNEKTHYRHFY